MPIPEWCQKNVRLPSEVSSNPGRYDLRRFPFWREPLECVEDPAVEKISIQAATQLGKTTLLQAILAAMAKLNPAPAMLGAPDRDACRELRDKFYRLAESTPAIAKMLPPAWKRNDQWIDFGVMVCHLAWSGNRQRLSGKACKYVLCTEVDRWRQSPHEGQTQQLIQERVKSFHRSLILNESTPTDETSAIADLYDSSDQRRYLVPCPACGHFQELRFFTHKEGIFAGNGGVAGFQHPDGNWFTIDQARDQAYYLCERGCRIESHEKAGMVALGRWVPKGQSIDQHGNLIGQPERSPRHAGFCLGSLYADTVDFGRMAAEYLESRESQKQLQSFWNNWLGLRWVTKTRSPKWQRVGRRLAGSHRRGTVPSNAFFLTSGIDTQDDCAYWIVRAWGEGSTSWLIDWGKVTLVIDENGQPITTSDLDKLDDLVLNRWFPLVQANPIGLKQLRVRLACIDYQGHRTWDVFQWVRARKSLGDRLRIIAGDTRVPAGEFYRLSVVEKTQDGKTYQGGLKRWAIDVDTYKEDVQGRFEAPLDKPGAWWLPEGILEEDSDYLRQICNEGRRMTRDKNGKERMAWQLIDNRVGNHYWDDEIYARCAADMVTGFDWNQLTERAKPKPKPGSSRGNRTSTRSSASQPYGRERE
jgi:phage terminase large subunit GpA-like protein